MKSIFRISIIASAGIVLFTSCSNVKGSTVYKELSSEISDLRSETSSANLELKNNLRKLDLATTNSKVAATDLTTLESEAKTAINKMSEMLMNDSVRAQAIQTYAIPACREFEKEFMQFELTGDDSAINTDLAGKKVGANKRAWYAYSASQEKGIPPGMAKLTSDFENFSNSCGRDGKSDFFKTCKTFDKRFMKKDPSSFKGQCVRGRVKVVQFDTNTGKCAFQGYLDADYDYRAQFGVTLNPENHQTDTKCTWISSIVQDMYVGFWAVGLDAYTYETSNGGKQTVPAFKIMRLQTN